MRLFSGVSAICSCIHSLLTRGTATTGVGRDAGWGDLAERAFEAFAIRILVAVPPGRCYSLLSNSPDSKVATAVEK